MKRFEDCAFRVRIDRHIPLRELLLLPFRRCFLFAMPSAPPATGERQEKSLAWTPCHAKHPTPSPCSPLLVSDLQEIIESLTSIKHSSSIDQNDYIKIDETKFEINSKRCGSLELTIKSILKYLASVTPVLLVLVPVSVTATGPPFFLVLKADEQKQKASMLLFSQEEQYCLFLSCFLAFCIEHVLLGLAGAALLPV